MREREWREVMQLFSSACFRGGLRPAVCCHRTGDCGGRLLISSSRGRLTTHLSGCSNSLPPGWQSGKRGTFQEALSHSLAAPQRKNAVLLFTTLFILTLFSPPLLICFNQSLDIQQALTSLTINT